MRDRRNDVDDKWQAYAVLLNPPSFVQWGTRWGTGITQGVTWRHQKHLMESLGPQSGDRRPLMILDGCTVTRPYSRSTINFDNLTIRLSDRNTMLRCRALTVNLGAG